MHCPLILVWATPILHATGSSKCVSMAKFVTQLHFSEFRFPCCSFSVVDQAIIAAFEPAVIAITKRYASSLFTCCSLSDDEDPKPNLELALNQLYHEVIVS